MKFLENLRQIWSFVVPRPPLLPVFEEISPYAVGLVSIKEYPLIRMIGRLKFNNEQLAGATKLLEKVKMTGEATGGLVGLAEIHGEMVDDVFYSSFANI